MSLDGQMTDDELDEADGKLFHNGPTLTIKEVFDPRDGMTYFVFRSTNKEEVKYFTNWINVTLDLNNHWEDYYGTDVGLTVYIKELPGFDKGPNEFGLIETVRRRWFPPELWVQ